MKNTFLAAFAALDEASRDQDDKVVFISPQGDQSTTVDRELETAAFVSRPDPTLEVETKPVKADTTSRCTGMTPFSRAAGLYNF